VVFGVTHDGSNERSICCQYSSTSVLDHIAALIDQVALVIVDNGRPGGGSSDWLPLFARGIARAGVAHGRAARPAVPLLLLLLLMLLVLLLCHRGGRRVQGRATLGFSTHALYIHIQARCSSGHPTRQPKGDTEMGSSPYLPTVLLTGN